MASPEVNHKLFQAVLSSLQKEDITVYEAVEVLLMVAVVLGHDSGACPGALGDLLNNTENQYREFVKRKMN